jgi:hypothetical protein
VGLGVAVLTGAKFGIFLPPVKPEIRFPAIFWRFRVAAPVSLRWIDFQGLVRVLDRRKKFRGGVRFLLRFWVFGRTLCA